MPWVLSLDDPRALDPRLAGAKGAGLAALARARFPTLPGFVVTTGAWERAGGLAPGRVPGLREELGAAARRLGPGPYAVRSSAAREDGARASWAGVLDTRLGVPAGGLLRAVAAVWRSAAGPRARAYRDGAPGAVAVVVQPVAPARAAGTCFTASPLGARTPLLVVEAVAGLAAPLAEGRLVPDRYLVDRVTGVVLEARPARQTWRLAPPPGPRRTQGPGGRPRRERLGPGAAAAPKLPRAVLARVARLALAAERRFGGPQDVEWVWTDRGVTLVQARPLTA